MESKSMGRIGSTRLPDFFIVGAPKSATTALYAYLSEHKSMYMSKPKEPHYFARDFPTTVITRSWNEYTSIFYEARTYCVAGEASVWYLYSDIALDMIKDRVPKAKIVVMLRNPVDAAYSLHNHKLMTFDEDIRDFWAAWHLNDKRTTGAEIPRGCREPRQILYRTIYTYSYQLERLFNCFDRPNVFIGFFEEFTRDPRGVYLNLLAFLGVPDDERRGFVRVNPNKQFKNSLLEGGIRMIATRKRHGSTILRAIDATASALLGRRRRNQVVGGVLRKSWEKGKKQPLDPDLRRSLLKEMEEEIEKVETLVGRNLDVWRV